MDTRIVEALNYIENNIDKPLQLEEISKVACMSPFHFHRLFKKGTGISLKQFIESLKMEKAKQCILQGDDSILSLAVMFGYKDYETFSRAFKKTYKISPDDLKSIVKKALEQIQSNEEDKKVIIITSKVQDKDDINSQISEELLQEDVSMDSAASAKVFVVKTIQNELSENKEIIIKNKFKMTTEPKLWENILNKISKSALLVFLTLLFCYSPSIHAQSAKGKQKLDLFLKNQGYTAIKLQKYMTGHLYTEVTMNGIKGIFILDTGAGATVVNEKKQTKFKMTASESDGKGIGAGNGEMKLQSSSDNTLIISGYAINKYNAILMNLDNINDAFRAVGLTEADGVIGADILTSGKAIIDYTNLILYLKK